MIKLDGEGLNELFKRGIINEKALKKINIVNYYESQPDRKHAIKKTADRFNCTVQNVHRILKNKRS